MPQNILYSKEFDQKSHFFTGQKRQRPLYIALNNELLNLYNMRKKEKKSFAKAMMMGLLVVALFVICIIMNIARSEQTADEIMLAEFRLKHVENISFSPKTHILVVNKIFNSHYTERSRYYLPLLPEIEPAQATEMLHLAIASGQQVAFDQAGNAYLIAAIKHIGNPEN